MERKRKAEIKGKDVIERTIAPQSDIGKNALVFMKANLKATKRLIYHRPMHTIGVVI